MDWTAVRTTVKGVGSKVAQLVRETPAANGAPALGTWSVSDLAAHLTHVWEFDTLQAQGAPSPVDDLFRLKDLTETLVTGEGDKSPALLADRVDAAVAGFLEATRDLPSDLPREWLGGVPLTVAGLASHAVSESLLHGHDLAKATGRPWSIERDEAVVAVDGFNFAVLADPTAHAFVLDRDAIGDVRATFRIKLRGGPQVWFVFPGDGTFRLERTRPPGPVDCHVVADPRALLLVIWGRLSQWPAIARGSLLAYGRKPWLGLRLVSFFRTP